MLGGLLVREVDDDEVAYRGVQGRIDLAVDVATDAHEVEAAVMCHCLRSYVTVAPWSDMSHARVCSWGLVVWPVWTETMSAQPERSNSKEQAQQA